MGQEPRKATDVLLDLESKMEKILDLIQNLDLINKLNSNKLNDIVARLDKQAAGAPKITVEAVQNIPLPNPNLPPGFKQMPAGDPERTVPFVAETALPQEDFPQGFRRNSRPETYAKDTGKDKNKEFTMYGGESRPALQGSQTPQKPYQSPEPIGPNVRPPPGRTQDIAPEIMASAPPTATSNRKGPVVPLNPMTVPQAMPQSAQGQIPVVQRCVDKNGKSIYLADVHITDMNTNQPVLKTRTNGMGKWMATLGIGSYRVEINKLESLSKEKVQSFQDVHVDGSVPKLDLPMLIIK
jgi:hypothetical protein